jgi:alpha-methylacyl-CoA racemase
MLLGDLGADVVRVDRPAHAGAGLPGPMATLQGRNKRTMTVDLKHPDGAEVVCTLVDGADVLVEGFRPGVAERLGLGPDTCRARNPALVYARMTGWGREGPLAERAGHDINYIGLTGALSAVGRGGQRPVPPLNLVGDYGGGALYLAVGVLAALVERSRSGVGDVVDAAMVDGAASLMLPTYELLAHGLWSDEREANLLDGAAPFYDTYEAADGRFLAVGPIEPQFFAAFVAGLGLDAADLPAQLDATRWPELKARIAGVLATDTRDAWVERFAGTDACVTPVLSLEEAPQHQHNVARRTFIDVGGIVEPAPAPRFARAATAPPSPAAPVGSHTYDILTELGLDEESIDELVASGAVGDGQRNGDAT